MSEINVNAFKSVTKCINILRAPTTCYIAYRARHLFPRKNKANN